MAERRSTIVRRLLDLSLMERRHLLSGDLAALGDLEHRKARLIAQLAPMRSKISADELRQIRKATSENQRLYGAAMMGIRNVRSRVSALMENPEPTTQVYQATGSKNRLGSWNKSLSKRA